MTRRCVDCGSLFVAQGRWQRRCWACWRDARDRAVLADAYMRGYADGIADAGRVDRDLLRDTVQLCHPDRHPPERRALATRTTATLLGLIADEAA